MARSSRNHVSPPIQPYTVSDPKSFTHGMAGLVSQCNFSSTFSLICQYVNKNSFKYSKETDSLPILIEHAFFVPTPDLSFTEA